MNEDYGQDSPSSPSIVGVVTSFICRTVGKAIYYKFVFFAKVVNTLINMLGYLLVYVIYRPAKQTADKDCQTYACYQDLTELMIHHFGKLHEENYVKTVLYRHQWNKLTRSIDELKEITDYNTKVLKEEMKTIRDMINKVEVSSKADRGVSISSFTTRTPVPPPPQSLLTVAGPDGCEGCKSSFGPGQRCVGSPERPLITVEALKSVQLRKTPAKDKTKTH